MTDTADHADYVLPATTQLEHLDVHTSYGHTYALINEPAIAPLGEAKPNTQIFRELAARMGFDEPCFRRRATRRSRAPRSGRNLSASTRCASTAGSSSRCPTRRSPTAAFRPPNGKCRVDVAGPRRARPRAQLRIGASTPELARRYPLAMISPPARNFLNSSFVNVTSLRDIEGEPVLEIAAGDAAARGIAAGSACASSTTAAASSARRVVGERARPGVVNGLGVWWKKLGADGTNVNELTHQRLTDIGRAPSFYDCLVEVERRPTPRRREALAGDGGPGHRRIVGALLVAARGA